jgi:CubicO group peptidase (beta-lactamase class C family)
MPRTNWTRGARTRAPCCLLAGLLCACLSRGADAPSPIAAVLKPFVDRHVLAGAVALVATKDGVLCLEAVGWADIGAKKPMPADALFWIASQSKSITGAAVMMLVDEDKVRVEDPVARYLPEFEGQKYIVEENGERTVLGKLPRAVMLRDVLSHTSGLPFMSRAEPKIDCLGLRESVIAAALSPLKFAPGTRYDYSNAGINTAGRVLEVASGQRFADFVEERLCRPLGMRDTTFWPSAAQLARLAKSYKPSADNANVVETDIGQLTYPLDSRARGPSPAGGYFSTASDIGRFCRMILRGGELDGKRYLSEDAVRRMTSSQTGDLPQKYGFGWSAGDGTCGHGGAYSTNMLIDVRRGLVFVFMVQHAGFPGDGGKSFEAFKSAAEKLAPARPN